MKDKLDYSKMIKQGIFTPNTSKRRNLTITHNSKPRFQSKIIINKRNENAAIANQRMLSPMPAKRRLMPFFSSVNSQFLGTKETQRSDPNKSEKHSRYSNVLNKSRGSIFSSIVMNYMQEESQVESICEKKRSFYKNIKKNKGKYSTFFEELTNNDRENTNCSQIITGTENKSTYL